MRDTPETIQSSRGESKARRRKKGYHKNKGVRDVKSQVRSEESGGIRRPVDPENGSSGHFGVSKLIIRNPMRARSEEKLPSLPGRAFQMNQVRAHLLSSEVGEVVRRQATPRPYNIEESLGRVTGGGEREDAEQMANILGS